MPGLPVDTLRRIAMPAAAAAMLAVISIPAPAQWLHYPTAACPRHRPEPPT